MCIFISIASISADNLIKVILFLGFAALIIAGPLLYRVFYKKEKFGWFRNPELKRLDKNQWLKLRNKADQIINGSELVSAEQLYELLETMQLEIIESYKRGKETIEYKKDCERITKLSEKLEAMGIKVEPFDSLVECLKEDGLVEQSRKLNNMVHNLTDKSFAQLKKEFLAELANIKKENWNTLSYNTRTKLKESIKCLRHNPFMSVYAYAALFFFGIGLKFYQSIVEDKGYEFYKKHPIWIVVFAVIIGVPALILLIKFLGWRYSLRANPYRSNLTNQQ